MLEPSAPKDRPPKMLMQYDPSGRRIAGPIIWKVSDTAVGPKFDPQGNIYIAEQIKPVDQPCPAEFADFVGPVKIYDTRLTGLREQICSMYGSILKFTPRGGMIDYPVIPGASRMHPTSENPFKGEHELDASLSVMQAAYCRSHRLHSVTVIGAEWMHMGISHVDHPGCNCENTRFDVDEFGRVWYPDLGRFRVGVLDTNGNQITHFGGYGNADSAGPSSAVPEPEIAFSWLVGVGVTDRYAYMGDSMNKRLLRAKLVYAAEETCSVP